MQAEGKAATSPPALTQTQRSIPLSQADSAYTTVPPPSYYVVMIDYGERGLEAIVDPAITERDVIERLVSREYQDVVYIHHVHDGMVEDVTESIFAQADVQEAA
jgi:hypothetical protein